MLADDRATWGTLEPRPTAAEYAATLRASAKELRRTGNPLRRLQSAEVLDAIAECFEEYAADISPQARAVSTAKLRP